RSLACAKRTSRSCRCSQQRAIRSTSSRSSGLGLGPARSARSSSSFRDSASLNGRFLPAAWSMMFSSTCAARSPPGNATAAGFSSAFRNAGRVEVSPACARRNTSRIAARSAWSGSPLFALSATPLPPLPLVLVVARRVQGRPGEQVGPLANVGELCLDCFVSGFLLLPLVGGGLALGAALGVQAGGLLAGDAAADVLAFHPTADFSRARVIPAALLPAHVFMLPPAKVPRSPGPNPLNSLRRRVRRIPSQQKCSSSRRPPP